MSFLPFANEAVGRKYFYSCLCVCSGGSLCRVPALQTLLSPQDPGPTPPLTGPSPLTYSSLLSMHPVLSESGRFAFNWNTFLFIFIRCEKAFKIEANKFHTSPQKPSTELNISSNVWNNVFQKKRIWKQFHASVVTSIGCVVDLDSAITGWTGRQLLWEDTSMGGTGTSTGGGTAPTWMQVSVGVEGMSIHLWVEQTPVQEEVPLQHGCRLVWV